MKYITANINISVLFSCRIQFCMKYSYSVELPLLKALGEDRISATKGKSCSNVLFLPTLLTSAFQFDTVF